MPIQSPTGLDTEKLRQEIRDVYALVARAPEGEFHFHRGAAYAADFLGYNAAELARLPDAATASFAGVGNPMAIDVLKAGETVLDVGSGAGMDLLLAARRVGPGGRAIGVDMTAEMLQSARTNAEECGATQVELRAGDAQSLPIENDSVDVVISNGVLNLTTDKRVAFTEIARVLKPGGRLLFADIALDKPLPEAVAQDIDLWSG